MKQRSWLAMLVLVIFFVVFAYPSISDTLHVSTSGTYSDNCTSDDPCSLQKALDNASSTPDNDTIYVEQGTYTFTSPNIYAVDNGHDNGSLTIIGNNTIFDGGGSSQILIIDTDNDSSLNGDNSIVVKIDNITFANADNDSVNGGGLYVKTAQAKVEITNCKFENDNATKGGGAYVKTYTAPIGIDSCSFSGDNATTDAGALYVKTDNGSISLSNSLFESNQTLNPTSPYSSGAASVRFDNGTTIVLKNLIFEKNYINLIYNNSSGALLAYEDTIFTPANISPASASLDNVTFLSNSGYDGGGAYFAFIGSLKVSNSQVISNQAMDAGMGMAADFLDNLTIDNVTFDNNSTPAIRRTSLGGGGIFAGSNVEKVYVVNSTFKNNFVAGSGGAIYSEAQYLDVKNTSFKHNCSLTFGGSIYLGLDNDSAKLEGNTFENDNATRGGSIGIFSDNSSCIIAKNSFDNVSATNGGGAVYVYSNEDNYTIEGNTFTGDNVTNYGGGALYIDTSPSSRSIFSINDNMFEKSIASLGIGGAVYIYSYGDTYYLEGNTFENDNATRGGSIGIFSDNSSCIIAKNSFDNVSATNGGGAVYVYSNEDNYTIEGNTFTGDNVTNYGGGALYIDTSPSSRSIFSINDNMFEKSIASVSEGGAIYISSNGDIYYLKGNTFESDNASDSGGAIYVFSTNSSLKANNNLFKKNLSSNGSGGAINIVSDNGTFSLANNLFMENSSNVLGGALHLYSPGGYVTDVNVINNTFYSNTNTGLAAGAMSLQLDNTTDNTSSANIYNNIFWKNTSKYGSSDVYIAAGSGLPANIHFYNNDLSCSIPAPKDNASISTDCFYIDNTTNYSYGSNIAQDPLFKDASNEDLHLAGNSPCINAGDNNAPNLPLEDFDGKPRIIYGKVDIGAYEYPYVYITSFKADPFAGFKPLTVTYTLTAEDNESKITEYRWDFNGDGVVDEITNEPTATHTFDEKGIYRTFVTAVDAFDRCTRLTTITVEEPPVNQPPVISSIEVAPTMGYEPLSVTVSVSASDPDGKVEKYVFSFGDDSPVYVTDLPIAMHTYNSPGKHTISVYVTDDKGANSTVKTAEVSVLEEASFKDEGTIIDNYPWAKEAIDYLYTFGITKGFPDGTYRPASDTDRGQIAAFLTRALNLKTTSCTERPFPDVPTDAWYCPYVKALKEAGITKGFPDGTYRPDDTMNRAQMAAFLTRALGLHVTACIDKPFPDVPTSAWYCPYVQALKLAGITKGFPDGTYRPDDNVTRAQMAVYLYRAFGEE